MTPTMIDTVVILAIACSSSSLAAARPAAPAKPIWPVFWPISLVTSWKIAVLILISPSSNTNSLKAATCCSSTSSTSRSVTPAFRHSVPVMASI